MLRTQLSYLPGEYLRRSQMPNSKRYDVSGAMPAATDAHRDYVSRPLSAANAKRTQLPSYVCWAALCDGQRPQLPIPDRDWSHLRCTVPSAVSSTS